jgi:hypothetical protein
MPSLRDNGLQRRQPREGNAPRFPTKSSCKFTAEVVVLARKSTDLLVISQG